MEKIEQNECEKWCGMSYCDEYGCINGKKGDETPPLLPEDKAVEDVKEFLNPKKDK